MAAARPGVLVSAPESADQLHDGHAGQRSRGYDNHAQQNIGFRVLLKVPEKFRSGDKAHRRHKADQTHVPDQTGHGHPQMAEYQRHQKNTRGAQIQPAYLNTSN